MTRAKLLFAVCLLLGLTTAAQAQVCGGDGECDDGNLCNGQETCVLSVCAPGIPPGDGTSCNNGMFCDGVDECSGETCTPSGINPCAGGGVCNNDCRETGGGDGTCEVAAGTPCTDDDNPCTDDQCDAQGDCKHPDNSAQCDDGHFCNGPDTCSGGTCTPSGTNPCAGGGECNDDCRETGVGTGTCEVDAGTGCTADNNPCTDDECNGGTCTHPNNSAPCNDGVFCNGMDQCSGGTCAPSGINPCASGGECNNACHETGGGAGSCEVGAGTGCTDDGNPCTNDQCDGNGACAHPNNTAPCDDGHFCNGMDACSGGTCTPSGVNPCAGGGECNNHCSETTGGNGTCVVAAGTGCTGDGNSCTNDQCDGLGACAHPARTGASCDDANFCNGMDTCSSAGVCSHSGNPCSGGPACQNVCNPTAKNCLVAAGTACPDETPGNPCTLDRCDGGGACTHDVQLGATCNDGQFCTATDHCDAAGVCIGSGDPCAAGAECAASCNEAADNCFAAGTVPCTDDGNVCTNDFCNGLGGCGHPPNTVPCEDSVFCNGADVCSGGVCTHAGDPCAAGAECVNTCNETADDCISPPETPCKDDGRTCTTDRCLAGVCDHAPVDALCDQGECVLGVCTPGAPGADKHGCVATPVGEGEMCTDDGFSCTDDTCSSGACLHVPIASRCVPPDDCTSAVCQPGEPTADAAGCIPGPELEEGQECAEDGEPCTNDLCRTGTCAHDDVPDTVTCEPVTRAFRQALALEGLARRLVATVVEAFSPNASGAAITTKGNMVAHLAPVTASLEEVSRILAGKSPLPPTEGRAHGVPKTLAQLRADASIQELKKKSAEVRAFLRLAATAKRKRQIPREAARTLRSTGHLVLERVRKLNKELRRLRRISQTFVP